MNTLGILQLENEPLQMSGALSHKDTFVFPTMGTTIAGASASCLTDGGLPREKLKDSYICGASLLAKAGVTAIIANCGFASLFQADVASSVRVPVLLSSLSLVPLVAATIPNRCRVGIVTFDATALSEEHYYGAGWSSDRIPTCVVGLEGSTTWEQLRQPCPDISRKQLVVDVLHATRVMLRRHPDVGALVLECAGFPPASDVVRNATGLLVADYVTMANWLMLASPIAQSKRSESCIA